jgi:hypothetical protein
MAKYIPNRSGVAIAAQHRKAGSMKHRNAPRGGARNEQADLLEEYEEDYAEGGYASRWDEERGYVPGR